MSTQDACNELRDLLPAYVIGATTEEERERVQILLQECPEVQPELEAYARMTEGLMQDVPPAIPPPNLKNKILEQVAEPPVIQPITPPRRRNPMIGWGVAAILILALVGTNLLWLNQFQSSQQNLEILEAHNNQVMQLLANQDVQKVVLNTTADDDETALATVLWDSTTNIATLVSNQLPPLEISQTYQVWLIGEDAPIGAGLFQADEQNQSLLSLELDEDFAQYNAVAISVEPASGSDAPTTDPIAVGAIGI